MGLFDSLPSLPSPGVAISGFAASGLGDFAIEALGTAALNRTYFIQPKSLTGIPILLVVFDCITSEQPSYSAEITQHPTEAGKEVTDHIQLKNPSLKLIGSVSNTPIDLATSVGNLLSGAQSLISANTFKENALNAGFSSLSGIAGGSLLSGSSSSDTIARAALLSAFQNKSIFDVVTKRQRYVNMAIQELKFPRDAATGKQVIFEVDMVQVRIISTDTVDLSSVAENVNTTAVKPTNLGSQVTSGVSKAASGSVSTSLLKKVFG